MFTRAHLALGLLSFSFFLFASCIKTTNTTPKETLISRATYYIDRGDYDTAIDLLETGIAYEDSSEMRLVLASAYAGRSGVHVENYWDYLIGFQAFVKSETAEKLDDIIPAKLLPSNLDEKSKQTVNNINEHFHKLQQLEKKTAKIPVISDEKRTDAMRARALLEQVNTASARLYRSILTAVVIKSDVPEGNALLKIWSEKKYDVCSPVALKISSWLTSTLILVDEGLEDLSHAYPDDTSYTQIRKDLAPALLLSRRLGTHHSTADALCSIKN